MENMATIFCRYLFITRGSCGYLSAGIVNHLSSIAHSKHFRPKDHPYNLVNRWKSKRELADHIIDSILVNQDGLIIFDKPYGVGAHPPLIKDKQPVGVLRYECYTLHDVLPIIGNALGVEHLIVARAGDKYSSGLSILATSEKVINHMKKCQRRDRCAKKLASKYLGVVVGKPAESHISESVKVALSSSTDGKSLQPLIYDNRKPSNVKKETSASVEYTALCTGYEASLVEIKTNCTQWHFLRVYAAHKLAPLLGDHIHGSRVKNVMGIPVAVNPFNLQGRTQVLCSKILDCLSLDKGEEAIIPCHIHFQEYTFTGWNSDRSDVTVVVPAPAFFNWTCKQLNLEIKR